MVRLGSKTNANVDLQSSSAKIRKMLELLRKIQKRDSEEKTIVFSQFTSMLDLIQPFLKAEGISYVRCEFGRAVAIPEAHAIRR